MRKNILQEIHPLALIREVEKWPVLYQKDSPERANVHLKNKMWLEVGQALFPDWASYTKPVQELKVQELTRKWRNLRDTFKRHVELEKRSRESGTALKKKKYVYFKYMLFLLPHLAPAPDAPDLPELDEYFQRRPAPPAPAASAAPAPAPRRRTRAAPDAPPPKARRADDDADIDEDRHFLLSLVPSFKRMSDDEKLIAKMKILKAIRQVKREARAPAAPLAAPLAAPPDPVKLEFLDVDDAHDFDADADADADSDCSEE